MTERYDIAVVGSGPAGISAAVNAQIRRKKVIVFGSENLSNKLYLAPKIDNYLGFPGISGQDLTAKFQEHLDYMNIAITYERIDSIYPFGEYFALSSKDKTYEALSVILAPGVQVTKPLKGENEFLGKGVGYCATCDAPLYKDKVVTIIGYNQESVEEANYVSELAARVSFIPLYKGDRPRRENITVIEDRPVEIIGDNQVRRLILRNGEIATDGVFILRDSIPPAQLLPGLLVDNGHIKVDRHMQTNIPGCFAAGDAVGKPYQYLKAMGEGQVAGLNAASYVDRLAMEASSVPGGVL